MSCTEIRDQLLSSESVETESLKQHLTECEACSAFARDLGVWGPAFQALAADASPPAALAAHIENQLAEEDHGLARLKAWSTPKRAVLLAASAVLIVAYQLVFSRRPDLADQSVYRVGFLAIAYTAVYALSVAFVLRPAFRAPPGRFARLFVLVLAAFSSVVLALAFEVAVLHPKAVARLADGAVTAALECFLYGSAFSALLLWVFAMLDRRLLGHFSQAPLACLAAGLVANLALFFHCSIEVRSHMLAGHALIGPAWAAAVGTWTLRARNRGRPSATTS